MTAAGLRSAAPAGIAGLSLRHLRLFLAVVEGGSVTGAAAACHVTQPAVTQAIAKIEALAATALFLRSPQGLFPAPAAAPLARRIRRALAGLDPALTAIAPRLRITATAAQLRALIASCEAENFTLAARRLGLAQPTVHRAVAQLEREVGRPLLDRAAVGLIPTRAAQALAQAARLAFVELEQAEADLAEALERSAGRIVIGAMPLARAHLLPAAIARFRALRPQLPIQIREGPYDDLLAGLRRGEIDLLIGALRDPAPIGDVEERELFRDTLVLVAGPGHPLAGQAAIAPADLAAWPWVVARGGTPLRRHFDAIFAGGPAPGGIIESSSLIFMRELLAVSPHLGCISRLQAAAEIARGLLVALPVDLAHTARPIGLTLRRDWMPTAAQQQFIDLLAGDGAPAPPAG